jgi:hypothetical protein
MSRNGNRGGRRDSEPDPLRRCSHDRHADVARDYDFFANASSENQHDSFPP